MQGPSRLGRAGRRPGPAGAAIPVPEPPGAGSPLPGLLIAAAALVAVTLAAYWAALGHGFVALDDAQYVTENASVLGKHYGELLLAVVAGNFHPLSLLSLALNVATPLSAAPFIATNIGLHAANTLLVFWLVWLLSNRRIMVAAFVALLFGIHPMHVESVAWISERKDLLYTFFFLAGLLVYWRYLARQNETLLALTFALFVLSCFAKGMAVTFPLVMVLLDYWHGRPLIERRAVLEKLPFLAVSVLFGLVALDVQGGGDFHGMLHPIGERATALTAPMALDPVQRLTLPTHGFMTYLARVFVPLDLCAFVPYPSTQEMKQPAYLVAPLCLLATLGLMLWDRRRTRVLTFGFGWFLATMVLVLQWVPVGGAIVADRYSYLSYVGLFFILGMGIQGAFERHRSLGVALWSAGGLFSLFLFFQTIRQVTTWKDAETLWTRILHVHPGQAWIHSVRGMERGESGRTQPALEDFRIALSLGLRNAAVYQELGILYGKLGRLDSSLIMLDRGLALEPSRGGLYYNRAATYQAMGRHREALGDMDRVITLLPDKAATLHGARGHSMMELGDYRGAAVEFDRAVAADSGNAELVYRRGCCRLRLGDRAGAERDFRATLRLAPGDPRARTQLQALGR
jgi:Flp pilus assembly protein TadD